MDFLRPASKCRTICGKTISPRSGSIGRLTGSVYFFFGLANAYFLLYPPCFRKISRRHAVIIHEVVFFCNRSRMTKCFLAKTVISTILEKNLHLEPFLIAVCLPQPMLWANTDKPAFIQFRTFTGQSVRLPPPSTLYHLLLSSLIFSVMPCVMYPIVYCLPVSTSVKTTSVSRSPLTFTISQSGCICSVFILSSSLFKSVTVCFFLNTGINQNHDQKNCDHA